MLWGVTRHLSFVLLGMHERRLKQRQTLPGRLVDLYVHGHGILIDPLLPTALPQGAREVAALGRRRVGAASESSQVFAVSARAKPAEAAPRAQELAAPFLAAAVLFLALLLVGIAALEERGQIQLEPLPRRDQQSRGAIIQRFERGILWRACVLGRWLLCLLLLPALLLRLEPGVDAPPGTTSSGHKSLEHKIAGWEPRPPTHSMLLLLIFGSRLLVLVLALVLKRLPLLLQPQLRLGIFLRLLQQVRRAPVIDQLHSLPGMRGLSVRLRANRAPRMLRAASTHARQPCAPRATGLGRAGNRRAYRTSPGPRRRDLQAHARVMSAGARGRGRFAAAAHPDRRSGGREARSGGRGARTAARPLFARDRRIEEKVVVVGVGAVVAEHVGVEWRVRLCVVMHLRERACPCPCLKAPRARPIVVVLIVRIRAVGARPAHRSPLALSPSRACASDLSHHQLVLFDSSPAEANPTNSRKNKK